MDGDPTLCGLERLSVSQSPWAQHWVGKLCGLLLHEAVRVKVRGISHRTSHTTYGGTKTLLPAAS
jgi:hypothetical protein